MIEERRDHEERRDAGRNDDSKGFSLKREGENFLRGMKADTLVLMEDQSWVSSVGGILLVLLFMQGCKVLCSEMIAARNDLDIPIWGGLFEREFWCMLLAAVAISLLLSKMAKKPALLCGYALMYSVVVVPALVVLGLILSFGNLRLGGGGPIALAGTLLSTYTVIVSLSLMGNDLGREKSLKQQICTFILIRVFVAFIYGDLASSF